MIKDAKFFLLFILFCYPLVVFSSNTQKQHAQNLHTKQTAGFTENKGQVTDQNGNLRSDVKYIYAAPGMKVIFKANSFSYEVYTIDKKQNISEANGKPVKQNPFINNNLEPEEVTIRTHRVDVHLTGANSNPQIITQAKSQSYSNYYLAHTPENGIQKIYSYSQLTYKNIWPNIDLVFYAKKEGELKYDIVLHPGADIKNIQFAYNGAGNIKLVNGNLQINTSLGVVEENIPLSYLAESKEKVKIEYTKAGNKISFTGKYNKNNTLVIDPTIIWATYFGGNEAESSQSVATDKSGNIYLTGNTYSTANIATTGAHQTEQSGNSDVYLVKFDAKGARIWGTYFGGIGLESSNSVVIDTSSGEIYIAGETLSATSIATSGAYQETKWNNRDAFLAKFDPSGKRIWATYIGGNGNDIANALTVDIYSNIFITGRTSSPANITTEDTHQPVYNSFDAFLMKFDSSGQKLWSTYYGGTGADIGYVVATDKAGNIYFGGQTQSTSDIVTPGAFKTTFGGAFLAKFNNSGKRIWATYYGVNSGDIIKSIAIDKGNNVYICGVTFGSATIASSNSHQPAFGGIFTDAFIAKFDSSGSRIWGSFYGGKGEDIANSVIADPYGNVFIAGHTNSTSAIATNGAYQQSLKGESDVFLVKFDTSGKRIWGTYYGGTGDDMTHLNNIALDNSFNIYLSGKTTSTDSISFNAVHQSDYGGGSDVFLLKINDEFADAGVVSIDLDPTNNCGSSVKKIYIKIKNYSDISTLDTVRVGWSVNDVVQLPKVYNPSLKPKETSLHITLDEFTFDEGINILKIWTYKPNNENDIVNFNDTFLKKIPVYSFPDLLISKTISERNVKFVVSDSSYTSYQWIFGDGDTSYAKNPSHRYPAVGTYNVTLLVKNQSGCEKLFTDSVQIHTNNIINAELQKGLELNVYPNPFRESFNFEYTLTKPSAIVVGIFDLNGREILAIPENTIKQPGKYTKTIHTDEHNLKPGIYMLRIIINNEAVTKRLIRIE